jgi:ribonuclease Z
VPEVAFTGDTTPDFILDKANKDVLESKLLIMEVSSPIPHAAVVIET